MRQPLRQTREGQQVAVNLKRKRVIIHLKTNGKPVCHSAGSTKLSQATAGGGKKNKVKPVQSNVDCGQGKSNHLNIHKSGHVQHVTCHIRYNLEMSFGYPASYNQEASANNMIYSRNLATLGKNLYNTWSAYCINYIIIVSRTSKRNPLYNQHVQTRPRCVQAKAVSPIV